MAEIVHVACHAACLPTARDCTGMVRPRSALAKTGGIFFDKSSTQHSNVCNRTAMAEKQVPEHSGGSGLDDLNGLPIGVPRVYELRPSTGAVQCYRRESNALWRLSYSENCAAYTYVAGFLLFLRYIFSGNVGYRLNATCIFFFQYQKAKGSSCCIDNIFR